MRLHPVIGSVAGLAVCSLIFVSAGCAPDRPPVDNVSPADSGRDALPPPVEEETAGDQEGDRDPIRRRVERMQGDLREELRYVDVRMVNTPRLQGRPVAATLVLTLKNDPVVEPYLFPVNEYVLETGGDPLKVHTDTLCRVMKRAFRVDRPLLEALREIEIGLQRGPVGAQVPLDPVVELFYALERAWRVRNTRVIVAVKGYADGQVAPWSRPLLAAPYGYRTITVLPPTAPGSRNPVSYHFRNSVVSVPADYGNEHLPDLRAEFVRRDLILPYLEDGECDRIETSVHVLKGFEFSAPNQPLERKVQIFLFFIPRPRR